jgi:hypothetical protein
MKTPSLTKRLTATLCVIALFQLEIGALMIQGDLIQAAHAQGIGTNTMAVLIVPPNRRKQVQASELERLMSRFVLRLERVVGFQLSPSAGAEEERRATELVEEALRALLLRTPKRARERLVAAKALLDKAPTAGNTRLWARFYKAQSLAALAANKLVNARDLLVKSVTLYPAQTDAEYIAYGATSRQLFKTVVQTVDSLQVGDLRVTGRATKGAEVWVDGVYKGRAPTMVADLKQGEHRLAIRLTGKQAVRQMIDVKASAVTKVKPKLVASPFAHDLQQGRAVLLANFNQPSVIEDRIRELRNEIGTDMILVVRARFQRDATALKGYFLDADGTVKKVKAEIKKDENYLDNLGSFVSTSAGTKLLSDPTARPLDQRKSVVVASKTRTSGTTSAYIDPNAPLFEEDKKDEDRLTAKWWFWAAVGGGAVLLGGLGYLAASGEEIKSVGATGTLDINIHKTTGP